MTWAATASKSRRETPGTDSFRTAARASATTRPAARMIASSDSVFSSTMRYFYHGITIAAMVRPPLTSAERARGVRLGELLRAARGARTAVEVAAKAGISVETLRKIE